jgi:hypothetical protein
LREAVEDIDQIIGSGQLDVVPVTAVIGLTLVRFGVGIREPVTTSS